MTETRAYTENSWVVSLDCSLSEIRQGISCRALLAGVDDDCRAMCVLELCPVLRVVISLISVILGYGSYQYLMHLPFPQRFCCLRPLTEHLLTGSTIPPIMCCDTAAFVALGCLIFGRANRSHCNPHIHNQFSPFADYPHAPKLIHKAQETTMQPTLHSLPTEIIQQIASYVPVSTLVSLKLTSRRLLLQLPTPPRGYTKTASSCEIKAIRRYIGERAEAAGGRRKCILCDGLMPIAFFRDPGLPVCKWHDEWFIKSVASLSAIACPDLRFSRVVSGDLDIDRVLCGHCKMIRGWDAECCNCKATGDCESCGIWAVSCHLRG